MLPTRVFKTYEKLPAQDHVNQVVRDFRAAWKHRKILWGPWPGTRPKSSESIYVDDESFVSAHDVPSCILLLLWLKHPWLLYPIRRFECTWLFKYQHIKCIDCCCFCVLSENTIQIRQWKKMRPIIVLSPSVSLSLSLPRRVFCLVKFRSQTLDL